MSLEKIKQGLSIEQLCELLPEFTQEEIQAANEKVGPISEADIPVVKNLLNAVRSEAVSPAKKKSKSSITKAKPSAVANSETATRVVPQAVSSNNAEQIHTSQAVSALGHRIKLQAEANERLRGATRAAAQHFVNEQQEIVDEFDRAMANAGIDSRFDVNHFLSQAPEELARFMS